MLAGAGLVLASAGLVLACAGLVLAGAGLMLAGAGLVLADLLISLHYRSHDTHRIIVNEGFGNKIYTNTLFVKNTFYLTM